MKKSYELAEMFLERGKASEQCRTVHLTLKQAKWLRDVLLKENHGITPYDFWLFYSADREYRLNSDNSLYSVPWES